MKAFVSAPTAAAALAILILSGCGGKPVEPPHNLATAVAGFDAYKSGNQSALEAQIQALAAQLPADQTSGAFVACSDEGYALRRIARVKGELEVLDRSPAFSIDDEARFIYFQYLVAGGDPKVRRQEMAGPTDFECERGEHHQENVERDTQEAYAIRDAGRDRLRAWFTALRAGLGPEFEPHMQQAAKLLKSSGLTDGDRWEQPNSIY